VNIKYIYKNIRNKISYNKFIYLNLYKIFKNKELVVNQNTDIVVEGFPRSGNSYLKKLIEFLVIKKNIKIASHTHSIAQVNKSIDLGINTIIMIRNPIDACISNYIFYKKK
jgi:hypothetical protein